MLIPTDKKDPLQEVTKSKAGGLDDDELQKYAKQYFASSEDSQISADVFLLRLHVTFLLEYKVLFVCLNAASMMFG